MRGDLVKQVPSSKPNNSILNAKLLNGVEKSYESGKYLLDESKKGENPAAKQQGIGAEDAKRKEIEDMVAETAKKVNVKVNVVRAGDEKGLSEKVQKGLRQLVGKEQYDGVMMGLYGQLPEEVRADVKKVADKKYKGDIAYAMDEYLAGKAEDGVTPSWWGKVVGAVRSIATPPIKY